MPRRNEPTHRPDSIGGGEPDDGFSGVLAELVLAVGQLRDTMQQPRKAHPKIPWEACHPVGFAIGQPVPLTAGAGTLGVTQDNYGPTSGYWWDLRRLSAWGWTAGTVTVYLNSAPSTSTGQAAGEVLTTFPTPGENTWGAQKMIAPGDSIIWVASGITGTVQVAGGAVEILADWVSEYLM